MAHGRGVDREFDVTERPLARLDAVDEVTVDTAGSGVTGDRLRRTFFIRPFHIQIAATREIVVKQLTVRIAASRELLSVFVMEDDFLGLQFPDINGESRTTEVMGAPVGHAATGIILKRPPACSVDVVTAAASVGMVRRPWGRAEPPIPVEAGGDGLPFLVAFLRQRPHVNIDRLDYALFPTPAGVDCAPVILKHTLAAAGDDPTIAPRGIDHQLAFAKRLGLGLLAVDILAVAACLDHHQRMPVVRCGTMHRVNVIADHDFAEVIVSVAVLGTVLLVNTVY